MKPGDLVQHIGTDRLGVLMRMYEVPNDRVPWEETYVRCIIQVGMDTREVISAPESSLRVIQELP